MLSNKKEIVIIVSILMNIKNSWNSKIAWLNSMIWLTTSINNLTSTAHALQEFLQTVKLTWLKHSQAKGASSRRTIPSRGYMILSIQNRLSNIHCLFRRWTGLLQCRFSLSSVKQSRKLKMIYRRKICHLLLQTKHVKT